jgi:hypothetical protein
MGSSQLLLDRSGSIWRPPNPRLQRTPLRAPLSRKPLGGHLR